MSATLDADKFATYFDDAPVLYVQVFLVTSSARGDFRAVKGRQYPVEIFYAYEPQPDIVDSCWRTIMQVRVCCAHMCAE
jgi:HrpA-like RNA helicase